MNGLSRDAIVARFNEGLSLLEQAKRVESLQDSPAFQNTRLYAAIVGVGALGWALELWLETKVGLSAVQDDPDMCELINRVARHRRLSAEVQSRLHAARRLRNRAEHGGQVPNTVELDTALRAVEDFLRSAWQVKPSEFAIKPLPLTFAQVRDTVVGAAQQGALLSYRRLAGWTRLDLDDRTDRNLLSAYLSKISQDSYRAQGFMLTSIVIDEQRKLPGRGYWELAVELNAGAGTTAEKHELFHEDQLRRIYTYYGCPVGYQPSLVL